MELCEMITKRRSFRKYCQEPLDASLLEVVRSFLNQARPLYPEIGVHCDLVTKEQVRFYFPWKAPHLVAVYSEEKEGYLENVGFLLQQLDLYLQSIGLGSCWLGLGKLKKETPPEGMHFVILLAFGYPEEGEALRQEPAQFRRRSLQEMSDREDVRLEPARLAPSSTNSQPWFFTHEGDTIHAFRSEAGLLRHKMLGTMNRIDMGIALAHLSVANPDTFRFYVAESKPALEGYSYCGSFTL